MSRPKLELVKLRKEYGDDVIAVDDIDLAVEAGETVALLGSSGCGKSTTLNMIVGLEQPTAGDIQIDGATVVTTPAGKRNVGLVFQDYAVFTHMTVRKNLAFGLEIRGKYILEINRAVEEVAELLGMTDKLDVSVKELGGSELQRVAIGRTLVTKPEILLLDEPLSNLEAEARLAMRRELRRLQSEIGLTIIYVTHDQVEALSLADRIAVMNAGRILQVEETSVIFDKPDHTFVAGFLGSPPMNLMRGKFAAGPGGVRFEKDAFQLSIGPGQAAPSGYYTVGIRPEALSLSINDAPDLTGRIVNVEPRGPEAVVTVGVGNEHLKLVAPPAQTLRTGDSVGLDVDFDSLVFFGGDSNRRVELAVAGRVF
ncbi:ATP-binding cassette domain-containing protein [Pseudodesulfovibrio cashew]|uniref:ATP-binding cassette domain-containing protein n=1 Tax=Pseudodesulfovibrio cashew TaxID=2678688 RepID=A0A6I6JCN1_9BACT|nr:ABC transporter ATP-binding protein [Pseudodesulfovibrio cashew]QGY40556.1 ATP-binding cassette domain-containing protein [Pseudodesulfovibrio cashew]